LIGEVDFALEQSHVKATSDEMGEIRSQVISLPGGHAGHEDLDGSVSSPDSYPARKCTSSPSWSDNPGAGVCEGFGVAEGFGVTHNSVVPMTGLQVNQNAALLNQQYGNASMPQVSGVGLNTASLSVQPLHVFHGWPRLPEHPHFKDVQSNTRPAASPNSATSHGNNTAPQALPTTMNEFLSNSWSEMDWALMIPWSNQTDVPGSLPAHTADASGERKPAPQNDTPAKSEPFTLPSQQCPVIPEKAQQSERKQSAKEPSTPAAGGKSGAIHHNVPAERTVDTSEATRKPKPDPLNLNEFLAHPEKYNPHAEILHCPINAEGDTVLYLAAKCGNEAAVETLIRASVQTLDWQNHKGITALSVAAHKGREPIVRLLLKAGAEVNIESNNGSTPLIQASHFGHLEVVRMVVEAGAAVDRSNNKGTTALMRAAQEGKLAVVEYLLCVGADVNRRNNERMTALMLGSQRGHAPVVGAVLEKGAEVDAQTAQGSTALMLACKRGHVDVVHTLLSAGAEINMKDSRGRTARDTAARRRHQKILSLLTHDKQLRLMQNVVVKERSHLLVKLWLLVSQRRASPRREAVQASSTCRLLLNTFGLSQPLFHVIIQFMPLPRIWDATLVKLRRRCHIDPNEAVRGGLKIIDEILTDLIISKDRIQEMHLVRLGRDESVGRYLKSELGMSELLFSWLIQWSDVQSIMSRVERGVTFLPSIAIQVVALASELHRWYRCHENSKAYSSDLTYFNNFPVNEEDVYDPNAPVSQMEEESSDGEE